MGFGAGKEQGPRPPIGEARPFVLLDAPLQERHWQGLRPRLGAATPAPCTGHTTCRRGEASPAPCSWGTWSPARRCAGCCCQRDECHDASSKYASWGRPRLTSVSRAVPGSPAACATCRSTPALEQSRRARVLLVRLERRRTLAAHQVRVNARVLPSHTTKWLGPPDRQIPHAVRRDNAGDGLISARPPWIIRTHEPPTWTHPTWGGKRVVAPLGGSWCAARRPAGRVGFWMTRTQARKGRG